MMVLLWSNFVRPLFREEKRSANIIAWDKDGVTCLVLEREYVSNFQRILFMFDSVESEPHFKRIHGNQTIGPSIRLSAPEE